jgi:hypothetical protein
MPEERVFFLRISANCRAGEWISLRGADRAGPEYEYSRNFDHGLNKAVNKLRETLGDSP